MNRNEWIEFKNLEKEIVDSEFVKTCHEHIFSNDLSKSVNLSKVELVSTNSSQKAIINVKNHLIFLFFQSKITSLGEHFLLLTFFQ